MKYHNMKLGDCIICLIVITYHACVNLWPGSRGLDVLEHSMCKIKADTSVLYWQDYRSQTYPDL